MYDIEFYADGKSLRMNLESGIIIKTIDGLTGTSALLDTVQNVNGVGTSVTGCRIAGKNLTVKGMVLDRNTNAKQALLDFFKPLRQVEMYVISTRKSSIHERYRRAVLTVKTSPVITQTKHSQFSINLYMAIPYFESYKEYEINIPANLTAVEATIEGDANPQYELSFIAKADNLTIGYLWCYTNNYLDGTFLAMDFSQSTAGKLMTNDRVKIWRENGRLRATINDVDEIAIMYANSKLWYLPLGTWKFMLGLGGAIDSAKIKYRSLHAGVLVDGV